MNEELELYKLCCTDDNINSERMVEELGWISDTEFCVWVSYFYVKEFIESLYHIFGYGIFDDGGFDANMQVGGVCIDLCEAVGHCIDIETVFPKEKYKH
jgi:hypothetical protein